MMRTRTLQQALFILLYGVLTGCTSTQTDITPTLPEPDRQYICRAGFVLGEPTRTFKLRTHYRGQDYLIQLGEPLAKQIAARFWRDAVAANSGRPQPMVAIGFDARTASRAGEASSHTLRVGLQFQIFHPNGQSSLDIVGGQSTTSAPEAAAAEALSHALHNMEGMLVNAGVCRTAN